MQKANSYGGSATEPVPGQELAPETGPVNKATVRIFRVLAAFIEREEPCGVTELSRSLGMTKSMVHRALVTLEDQGYVTKDLRSGLYQLGYSLLELSSPTYSELTVHDLAAPFFHELMALTQETVMVSVQSGRRAVIVGGLEGPQPISLRVSVGATTPLHVEPAGRCILANLPSDDIARYFSHPLERYTAVTIVDSEALRSRLQVIRDTGFDAGVGDLSPDLFKVGYPILDGEGVPHGAISIAGPADRFQPRFDTLKQGIENIIAEISRTSRLCHTMVGLGEE